MAPTVSQPKQPDDTDFLKSLNSDEKAIHDLYTELESNKDEKKLIKLIESGKLLPNDRNKLGQTPLMLAVEANFSTQTLVRLIQLKCDVNAKDVDGMTCLHKAIWCESLQIFETLL